MAEAMPLANFGVSTPSRLLIYVSGFMLILSFFVNVKDIPASGFRVVSGLIFGLGILFWMVKRSISDYGERSGRSDTDFTNTITIWLHVLDYIYLGTVALILITLVF